MRLSGYALTVALCLIPLLAGAGELERATSAFDHHDYQKAKPLLQPLADRGDPVAQYELGVMYEHGWGVEQDFEEALMWLQRSADQHFSWAEYLIGDLYNRGIGVPKDKAKAKEWWQKANAPGNNAMQFNDRYVGPPRYRELQSKYRPFPSEGVIPNEATAIKVAEAILTPLHGEASIKSREPFSAVLKGDVWTVSGHISAPGELGAFLEVDISKSRGCILGINDED